jgi:methyl-accepting chemotaxis protein
MVDHTHKVIEEALKIEAAAVDMETGMRGYLLAGDESFLEPYVHGGQIFTRTLEQLKITVSDNPQQVARLAEIKTIVDSWKQSIAKPTIELRRQIGNSKTMDDIADLVGKAEGKVYFDTFRGQISTFIERERNLLAKRTDVNEQTYNRSLALLGEMQRSGEMNRSDYQRMSGNLESLKTASEWVNHTHKVIGMAKNILASAIDMETGMRGYLLSGSQGFLEPYQQGSSLFAIQIKELKQLVSDNPSQVHLLDEIHYTVSEWQSKIAEPYIALRTEIGDSQTMNDMAKLVGQAKGKVYFDQFREAILTFIDVEDSLMVLRQQKAENAVNNANQMILLGAAFTITLGAILSWIVLKSITGPINDMAIKLESLAQGDLTQSVVVESNDELGKMANSYNQTVQKTNKVMREVLQTSEEVSQGALEITQSNEIVANELGKQSEQVSQISTAIEQISSSIQEVASSSSQATTSAQNAGDTANSGGEIVRSTIAGMHEIDQAVMATSQSVSELGKRGAQIGEIINVIDDIAEQTNLLALNAAIEAARAGEAGRGFAVVADEVRALADRTTSATTEIASSIEAIQTETQTAVARMEVGNGHVKSGLELAQKAGDSLDDIVSGAQSVAMMIDSIAAAAEEQSQASHEVSKRVESVAELSKGANEKAGQVANSAQALSQRSIELNNMVKQFKVS